MVTITNGEIIIDLHLKKHTRKEHQLEFHGLETMIENDIVEMILLCRKGMRLMMYVPSGIIGLKQVVRIVQYMKTYGDELWIDLLIGFIIVNGEWILYIEFTQMILTITLKID
jgi:hypothetical protein